MRTGTGAWWAVLGVALSFVPTAASADVIDDLAVGTWKTLEGTPMRAVCPPASPEYDWNFFCSGVVTAWGGAAFDDTRDRLIVWGGGHADYRGNEVYAFDLISLEWERLWGPTPLEQIPAEGTHEVYGDGNPGSRHTYSGLTYIPPPHDALVSMGGSLWNTGFYATGTWSFSFENSAWSRLAEGPEEFGYGDPSVFDPLTGHVFRRANSGMLEYDVTRDDFTRRAEFPGGFYAPDVSAALDPHARLMLIVGMGRVDTYDLDTDIYTVDVPIKGAGVADLFGEGSPGLDFDTSHGRFVLFGGGQNVYTYDPSGPSFELHSGRGDDPGEITGAGGAFGRFRYVASRKVFVWVDSVDADVSVFRMTAEDIPPTMPTDGSDSADGSTTRPESSGGAPAGVETGSTWSTGEVKTGSTGGIETDDLAASTVTAATDPGPDTGCSCRASTEGRPRFGISAMMLFCLLCVRRRRVSRPKRAGLANACDGAENSELG